MPREALSMKRRHFLLGAGALWALRGGLRAAPTRPRPTSLPGTTPETFPFLGPVYRLPVNGVQLAYRDFGAGPPLLLLGEQSTTMNWWPPALLRGLAQNYRILTVDPRGVGYSTDNPAAPARLSQLAEDCQGLLLALGLSSTRFLGWGMGANVGLFLALQDSRRIERLILSGGDPGGSLATACVPEVQAILANGRPRPERLATVMFSPAAREAKQQLLETLAAMPEEAFPAETIRRQQEALAAWRGDDTVANKLGAVSVPVLVHYGSRDVVTPPANGELLAARLPGARAEEVEGGGHACLFEQPDSFLAVATEFLR